MNKKISVALATYNGEKFILQQLDSLRNQTHLIDEVIIIDDASSDLTSNLVINYIHEYNLNWKFYINKVNLGYKKNFKEVLKKTLGDIIFLCDQDDIWENTKIEEVLKIFNNPNVKCVNTSFTCVDENNEQMTSFSFLKKKLKEKECVNVPFEDIIISNISMGCTMAFTKEIKDLYLKHSNGIAAHDWELNCISSLTNGLYYLNKPLIKYRIHQNNTTGIDTFKKISKKETKNYKLFRNRSSLKLYDELSKIYERFRFFFIRKMYYFFKKKGFIIKSKKEEILVVFN